MHEGVLAAGYGPWAAGGGDCGSHSISVVSIRSVWRQDSGYLFVTFSLCPCPTFLAGIAAPFRKEIILAVTTVYSTTNHDSLGSKVEDGDATSDDQVFARVLGYNWLKSARSAHG